MPKMGLPSCEIENDNSRVFQGKQIRAKNKESFESEVLKQKQHLVAVAVAVLVLLIDVSLIASSSRFMQLLWQVR